MKPIQWDIRREGRIWSHEESNQRTSQAPEKIEYVNGIFASDRERLIVLGMLLENLGIDKAIRFGKIEDWKAAIGEMEKKQGFGNQP
jgi:dihydropteroate synthase